MNKKVARKREVGIERLNDLGKQIWAEQMNEGKIVKDIFKVFKSKERLVRHSDENISIICAVDKGTISKHGTYIETMVYYVCKELSNVSFLDSCSAWGLQTKHKDVISIPISLYLKIEEIKLLLMEKKLSMTKEEDINTIFKEIYTCAVSDEVQADEDIREWTQDLDLGFIGNDGKVYLYEVKKTGDFGADVALKHFMHYFYAYANYVYHNEPAFDKIVCNFLLVERKEDEAYKHMIHGPFGFVTFKEFCDRHNIIITEDETFNLFYYLTQVNDKEFVDTIERVRNMLMDNPKLKELTPAMFLKEYRKVYPTRDV